MNKKITLLSVAATLVSIASFKFAGFITNADNGQIDYDAIIPLSHANGAAYDPINASLKAYWDADANDMDNLIANYEYNNDVADNFAAYYAANDPEQLAAFYAKYDDNKPINNTLKWKSNLSGVKDYSITIALDEQLTEAVIEENVEKACEYTYENPFTNKEYYWQVTATLDNDSKVKSPIFNYKVNDYKRTLVVSGVSNFRDVGGFTSSYGEIKQGLVYRSACLDSITNEGKATLNELNVQTDLDLRGAGFPNNPAGLERMIVVAQGMYGNVCDTNFDATFAQSLRTFTVADNYPIDFHCAIGRDRTGTLCYLLQGILGATDQYKMHEYFTSLYSVTGTIEKNTASALMSNMQGLIESLKARTGCTDLNEACEAYAKAVGLTDEEIASIRNIMTGKTELEHEVKPFKATENYEGKHLVTFKAAGKETVINVVNDGDVISAPYQLDSGYAWYVDGEVWNNSAAINKSVTIYADVVATYTLTIHFVDGAEQDIVKQCVYNQVVRFSDYDKPGYETIVLNESGKAISKITVTSNTYVNVIYVAIP